jgi:hypothetical protein
MASFGGKFYWSKLKNELKRKAHGLEDEDIT